MVSVFACRNLSIESKHEFVTANAEGVYEMCGHAKKWLCLSKSMLNKCFVPRKTKQTDLLFFLI
jgi:hypothetical protein